MAVNARNKLPPFKPETLEAIAKVLADTDRGLTGTEIGQRLRQCQIPDVDETNTKWKRLYNAFADFQNEHQVGNHVVKFITVAMSPESFTGEPERFEERRQALNAVLSFAGVELRKDGKVRRTSAASNLDDALTRSNRMKEELRRRNVHSEVIRFCDAELIANNYFHAVFEAMKSITSRIRELSGETSDGAALVEAAFSFGKSGQPRVAINTLSTNTERGEQHGFVNLLKGLYGTVRNPLGHEAKIEWEMLEQDALDILTTVSLIHRKLEKAVPLVEGRRTEASDSNTPR
jgi:uncharacterized protein (TIGR02391 family)